MKGLLATALAGLPFSIFEMNLYNEIKKKNYLSALRHLDMASKHGPCPLSYLFDEKTVGNSVGWVAFFQFLI